MHHQFNIQQLYALPRTVFIWEQTATCATYSINWLVFITEMKSVYSAVRTGSLNKAVLHFVFKGIMFYTSTCPMMVTKVETRSTVWRQIKSSTLNCDRRYFLPSYVLRNHNRKCLRHTAVSITAGWRHAKPLNGNVTYGDCRILFP